MPRLDPPIVGAPPSPLHPEAPRLNVLLVEDNPGDARLIRALLAEASHAPTRVVHVERLAAALERLRQPGIDVVLLDLGLPDSQGLATFGAVHATAPRLPVVVLSGQTDTTLALHAVREGAQDYLLKGHVDPEILARALRYAVEHQRIAERQRFLFEASRAVAVSLEYEATLERVVRLPVPFLADACLVELLAEERSARRLVVHDVDRARGAELQPAGARLALDGALPQSGMGVPAGLERLGFTAGLVAPLAAHGSTLGKLWLLRAGARPGFGREEADVLDEFALHAALALENARLHRELQVAVGLRDEVLAATSHDLRSPLSGIQLQGVVLRRLLRADPAAADAEVHARVARGLDEVDAAVGRCLGLIQELLDVAALQSGQQLQLARWPIDLAALTRRVVAEHQARTEFHSIQVRNAAPLVGEWDPQRLARVLDNLLSNALKYSVRGDTISVALAREADADGDWAVVRVQDHGVGIPAAELGRIFDRFYRGSNVAAAARGVGIGLSGARQIVEQHGGRITVESQEHVGSTFTVRLPLPATQERTPGLGEPGPGFGARNASSVSSDGPALRTRSSSSPR